MILCGATDSASTELAGQLADSGTCSYETATGRTASVTLRCSLVSTATRNVVIAHAASGSANRPGLLAAAAWADLAVLVLAGIDHVDHEAHQEGFLAGLVGPRRFVLAVAGEVQGEATSLSHDRFDTIVANYRTLIGNSDTEIVAALPLSFSGVPPWYGGPNLLGCLDRVDIGYSAADQPLRMTVTAVTGQPGEFSGTVVAGQLRRGDPIRLVPGGATSLIAGVVANSTTGPTDEVTVVLQDNVAVSTGQLLCAGGHPAEAADQFETHIIWLHDQPMLPGRPYLVEAAGGLVGATIAQPKYRVTGKSPEHHAATKLEWGEIGVCNLALDRPIAFDPYAACPGTGGFSILDRQGQQLLGIGLIHFALRRAHNVHWQAVTVDKSARHLLNNHGSAIIWFTGLSGSGKSAIANAVERRLYGLGVRSYLLDGDNVRHGLNRDLGFTAADRVQNVRRVAEVAVLMADAGLIVLTALISPFSAERQMARERAAPGEFFEVFVDTPLEVAEARDPKGLYAKARRGELVNFTGIDSPYERPESPEIDIDTTRLSVEAAADAIIERLVQAGIVAA